MIKELLISIGVGLLILFVAIAAHTAYDMSKRETGPTTDVSVAGLVQYKGIDGEQRRAIGEAYCNILRAQQKLKTENFEECVRDRMMYPLQLYKAITGIVVEQDWSVLDESERKIIVDETLEKTREILYVSQIQKMN